MAHLSTRRAGLYGVARRIIESWALLGGALLLMVVLLTAYSLLSGVILRAPLPGDFEMVEVGVAVAVFSFLPYCQVTGANVRADIFTSRASPRVVAMLTLLAALVAFAFSALMLWRMSAGLVDYWRYRETTAIIGFPIWIAFIPILVSLALLAVAAFMSLTDAAGDAARHGAPARR